jgi:ribulose-phosphate 3-epimerase
MIVDPDRYTEKFAELGVKYLSVHYEACTHLHRSLQKIKSLGMKAGIALNPHTPVNNLYDILPYADFVLIMSVNPGYGGQQFIDSSLNKIARLRKMITDMSLNTLIEVDGGVNLNNAPLLTESGADILVAGNTIFGSDDPEGIIRRLKGEEL